jgi:hypothetical protein
MKPFVVFRAPESIRWNYRPHGKNRYRLNAWVKLPITGETLTQDIRTKEATTIRELMPLINRTVDELMDVLRDELFTHWATYLLSITDETTDEEIDKFHDEFPESDYGFECYVWG